jgi:hypothetical protein
VTLTFNGTTMTFDGLRCEEIGAGDWETIRDFMNDGVSGSGDAAYGMLGGLRGGGIGLAKNAPGRLGDYAEDLAAGIRWLTLQSSNERCSAAGVAAQKRFQRGDYVVNPFLPRGVGGVAFGPEGSWRQVQVAAHIIVGGVRETARILAEEEYHKKRPWSMIPPWGSGLLHGAAANFGYGCSGLSA